MKRIQLSLLVIIIITLPTKAQWNLQNSNTKNHLFSTKFINSSVGWVVGDSGTILKTTNGGLNWNKQVSGTSNRLESVFFLDENTGWAAKGDGILRTTNGGDNWETLLGDTMPHHSNSPTINSVYFFDKDNGFVLGKKVIPFISSSGMVFRTTNGGTTWQESTFNFPPSSFCFSDKKTGWIVGSFSDREAGAAGYLLKTSDNGLNWSDQTPQTWKDLVNANYTNFSWLITLYFLDQNNGWLIGYIETLSYYCLRTTDGGNSWIKAGSLGTVNSIFFVNQDLGWGIGDKTIEKTINGGANWYNQAVPVIGSYLPLISVYFTDENNGWVVGYNGTILHTTNGGGNITSVMNNPFKPESFSLDQNYPNPFNPSTTIRYSIPNTSFVTLKVYNVLGKEVATLVNEEKSTGNYEVKFDGSNLTSDIYFYKIQAGNYTSVKKMVLIK